MYLGVSLGLLEHFCFLYRQLGLLIAWTMLLSSQGKFHLSGKLPVRMQCSLTSLNVLPQVSQHKFLCSQLHLLICLSNSSVLHHSKKMGHFASIYCKQTGNLYKAWCHLLIFIAIMVKLCTLLLHSCNLFDVPCAKYLDHSTLYLLTDYSNTNLTLLPSVGYISLWRNGDHRNSCSCSLQTKSLVFRVSVYVYLTIALFFNKIILVDVGESSELGGLTCDSRPNLSGAQET